MFTFVTPAALNYLGEVAEFGIHPQGRLNLEINLKCPPTNTALDWRRLNFSLGRVLTVIE